MPPVPRRSNRVRRLVWVCVLFALIHAQETLYARETRGVISGRVLDPQGTTVSGASLTVTNTGTAVNLSGVNSWLGLHSNIGNSDYSTAGNVGGFERTPARAPAAFHRRVFPTRIDGLRSDMTNQWKT